MTTKYIGTPLRIAVFESADKYSFEALYTEEEQAFTKLARVSEWVEVVFTRLDEDAILPAKLAEVDSEIAEVRVEFKRKLQTLNEKRQNLLALTYAAKADPDDRGGMADEKLG